MKLQLSFGSPRFICLVLSLTGLVAAFLALHWYMPDIRDVTITFPDSDARSEELPISFPSTRENMDFSMTIETSAITPVLWRIRADDCLTRLQLNGVEFPQSIFETCYIDRAMDYSFEGIIVPGINVLKGTIRDTGGMQGLRLHVSNKDAFHLFLRLLIVAFVLLLFYSLLLYIPGVQKEKWIALVLLGGAIIRIAYFDVTPFDARGNDIWGHIDYIRYVWTEWAIPPVHGGWQFYQPPLYYFLFAVVAQPLHWLSIPEVSILRSLQFMNTIISALMLLLLIPISGMIFPHKSERHSRLLWMSLVVTVPTFVFIGTQINNDAFVVLFSFITIALLLYFWRSGSLLVWYASVITVGLALLTKSNAMLLIPTVLLTMACFTSLARRRRLLHIFLSVLVLFSMTFWLHVHRTGEDPDLKIVGNVDALHTGLLIPNSAAAYAAFRPIEILQDPFANTWDGRDRSYFWEYYFHSALFGEYAFPASVNLARALIALGLVMLICILGGFFYPSYISWDRAAPLLFFGFFLLVGHVAFRWSYPYASSQHFRYTAPVFLLLAYLAVRATAVFSPHLRTLTRLCLWTFVCLAAAHTLLIGRI